MKGAEALVVGTGSLQREIRRDDLNDISSVANFLDDFFRYLPAHHTLISTTVTFSPPEFGPAA